MTSKTAMLDLVKGFRAAEVSRALKDDPVLIAVRDKRGRNWLHICCGRKLAPSLEKHSIATAKVLLDHYDMSAPAFTEGGWKATPVWYAVGWGRNLALAEFLLKRGADPNHALWAASFNKDIAAIRLLVEYGADIDPVTEDSTPLLGAVKWSLFGPAEELLKAGANPDWRDSKGLTALHHMLKKNSDPKHIAMVVRHGARGDIADPAGRTAIDILRRKKDPTLRKLAEQLAARA
ncbi:MAG TPA: hypothetical protein VG387_02945 [Rhizomicrobium sp.]|jgi:hypothetical protein|nr:hypothetical protein [Rhizomicrobium sp.]